MYIATRQQLVEDEQWSRRDYVTLLISAATGITITNLAHVAILVAIRPLSNDCMPWNVSVIHAFVHGYAYDTHEPNPKRPIYKEVPFDLVAENPSGDTKTWDV